MIEPVMVYSGAIRDNGTPFYTRLALAQVLGKDPDWYNEDPTADPIPQGRDFFIHVDDGRDDFDCTNIPHPWGYWAIDSHLGPDIRIAKAKLADVVWCAQKPFVKELAKHGVKASWLPLACEPLIHLDRMELAVKEERTVAEPDLDLAFVGHLGDAGRLDFLDSLFKAFPNSWLAFGHFHEDMARVYHRARLGVNHAVRDDLNMRFFELACMGVLQLADARMVGLDDLGFHRWQHYVPYDEILDPVRAANVVFHEPTYLGQHERIAEAAQALVRGSHTYRHRVATMLEDIGQFLRR